ncbi:hypothetical protein FACS189450_09430 [Spirochaetia bacterium]|nr:hypothetical protein FACS189450_09430 [Spirochaetia bacterium]
MSTDSFKADIINQLMAMEEGGAVHNPLEPYFCAFTGAFRSDMPFTFYFEAINRPVMFVYEPASIAARSSRYLFMERCEQIKAKVLSISGVIRELADEGYISVQPLKYEARPALPGDYIRYWRKYQHFYQSEAEGLSFVCLSRFGAEQKLYNVRGKFHADRLVG